MSGLVCGKKKKLSIWMDVPVSERSSGWHRLVQILSASLGLRAGWAADQCRGRPVALMEEIPSWDRLISNTVTFVLQLWASTAFQCDSLNR